MRPPKATLVHIYALYDPADLMEVRYIGQTTDSPKNRLYRHIYQSRPEYKNKKKDHKSNWIRTLLAKNVSPEVRLIETADIAMWGILEKFWIARFKKLGHRLTNGTEGGDGVLGLRHTEASRKKMSLSHQGQVCWLKGGHHTEEAKRNISKGLMGQVSWLKGGHHTEAAKLKISIAGKGRVPHNKGKKSSPELRLKLSASHIGIGKGIKKPPRSAEHSMKISIANRGRVVSEEMRQRISATLAGCKRTAETKNKISIAAKKRVYVLSEKPRSDSTSGFKQVYFRKETGKWRARIGAPGNEKHIGEFNSPENAATARAIALEMIRNQPLDPMVNQQIETKPA